MITECSGSPGLRMNGEIKNIMGLLLISTRIRGIPSSNDTFVATNYSRTSGHVNVYFADENFAIFFVLRERSLFE
jgi:hypothetical protein